MKLKVGQRLFYVRDRGSECEIVVVRVGRKWAYAFDAEIPEHQRHPWHEIKLSLSEAWNGGHLGSGGTAWLSKEARDARVGADRAAEALHKVLSGYGRVIPRRITAEEIRKAAEILGVLPEFEKNLEQRKP